MILYFVTLSIGPLASLSFSVFFFSSFFLFQETPEKQSREKFTNLTCKKDNFLDTQIKPRFSRLLPMKVMIKSKRTQLSVFSCNPSGQKSNF